MLALVMSGAANYGAMQAGALQAFLEGGLRPKLIVGSSAGALNAIYLASDPTPQGVARLQDVWRQAGPHQVGIPTPLSLVRRLVAGEDSLVDSQTLASFLRDRLPAGVETFGALRSLHGVAAYAVAVCLESGELVVFGDHPEDRMLDGAMASSAVPPYFPPWRVGDRRYLDGGVYSKLPLQVAIERGPTQIVALDVGFAMGSHIDAHGVLGVGGYSISLMVERQATFERAWCRARGVPTRILRLTPPRSIPFWDYAHAGELIDLGREVARGDLQREPLQVQPAWRLSLRRLAARASRRCPAADELVPEITR